MRAELAIGDLDDRRADLCLTQRKRDLLARELRLLHAKSSVPVSFDFARFLSFPPEAFSGTGSKRIDAQAWA